jgi:hypothetical protein
MRPAQEGPWSSEPARRPLLGAIDPSDPHSGTRHSFAALRVSQAITTVLTCASCSACLRARPGSNFPSAQDEHARRPLGAVRPGVNRAAPHDSVSGIKRHDLVVEQEDDFAFERDAMVGSTLCDA